MKDMKSGKKPELSKKWWEKNGPKAEKNDPKEVLATGLGKALGDWEELHKKLGNWKTRNLKVFGQAQEALNKIVDAAKKDEKKYGKLKDAKKKLENTFACLNNYSTEVKKELKRLQDEQTEYRRLVQEFNDLNVEKFKHIMDTEPKWEKLLQQKDAVLGLCAGKTTKEAGAKQAKKLITIIIDYFKKVEKKRKDLTERSDKLLKELIPNGDDIDPFVKTKANAVKCYKIVKWYTEEQKHATEDLYMAMERKASRESGISKFE